MGNIQKVGLLTFIIYLFFFTIIFTWLAPGKYDNFSFKTHWLSNLGEKESASYPFFAVGFDVFALLGIFLWLQLKKLLNFDLLSKLAIFFLFLSLISMFLISFFPMDTKTDLHNIIAGVFLFNLTVFNLLMAYLCLKNSVLPKPLAVLNMAIVLFAVLFAVSTVQLMQKYSFLSLYSLIEVSKRESSLLIKGNAIWEWTIFYLQIAWSFWAGTFLLFRQKRLSV